MVAPLASSGDGVMWEYESTNGWKADGLRTAGSEMDRLQSRGGFGEE